MDMNSILPPATATQPTQPSAPGADLGSQWNDWVNQPGNRALLGQMGAMLLQPAAPGQTMGGQIGQAFAGGAAAKSRNLEAEQKRRQTEAQLAQQQRTTDIAQQNADTSRMSAETSDTFNKGYLKNLDQTGKDAADLRLHLDNLAKADSENIMNQKYSGKSIAEIQADPEWQQNAMASWQLSRSGAAASPTLSGAIGAKPGAAPVVGHTVKNSQGTWRYTGKPGAAAWEKVG